MTVESATHISDLDPSTIGNATDPTEGGAQVSLVKTVLTTDFANISGAVTASHTELNYNDITTLGTAQASKVITADASANVNGAAITWTDLGSVTTCDINGGTIDGATIGGASAGAGTFTTCTITTADINGGAIDGAIVGASSAAAGTFTNLTASTDLTLASGATVTAILDEDAMGSDSATALATQQSIKAYVDARTHTTVLNWTIADVSTLETLLIPVPVTGTVTRVDTVLEGTISGADAIVTLKTSADLEMATLTIANVGSAAGDVDSDTSINNSSVTAGQYLKLATDGASTGVQRLWVSIVIQSSVG